METNQIDLGFDLSVLFNIQIPNQKRKISMASHQQIRSRKGNRLKAAPRHYQSVNQHCQSKSEEIFQLALPSVTK